MDNCAVEATWLSFPSGLDYPRRRKTGVLRPNHRLQHSPDERRQNAALMPQGRSHWVSRIVTLGCSGPGSGHRHPYRTHVAALLCPRRIGLFDRGSRTACSPRRSDTGAPSPCGASNGSSTPGWPGAWLCPEACGACLTRRGGGPPVMPSANWPLSCACVLSGISRDRAALMVPIDPARAAAWGLQSFM